MSLGSITTQYLTDIANAIRAKLGVATTYKPSQMAAAIASIPTGGTPTLQTKTATYTPSGSAQTDTITPDAGYDGLDEVDITVNAAPRATIAASSGMVYDTPTITVDSSGLIRSSYQNYGNPQSLYPITADGWAETTDSTVVYVDVSGTQQMATQAATTWRPSTSDQTIASGKYLTGAQTIKGVVLTNLTAGNIKQGVTVEVGDSSDLDLISSVTGTYAPTLITKSITANGTYNASSDSADGYSSVTVNVSGGGGATLLGTKSLGTISTTSTSAVDTGQTATFTSVSAYDLLILKTYVDTPTNNRHLGTTQLVWMTGSSNINSKNGVTIATATHNEKLSSSAVTSSRSSTTKYGVYANTVSIYNSTGVTFTVYQRYNSTQTGTINGSYTMKLYGVKLADLT